MTTSGMAFYSANFMLQTPPELDNDHQPSTSLAPNTLPSCPPQHFHGMTPFLGKRSTMSFSGIDVCEENHGGEDDLSDDGSQMGEKKRRLNMEQVRTLEKNFELGNKLEPERKMQLARALGLQPRQIAIWFQNRRARWKTKQLEKDYEVLKRQFEAVKAENEALQVENQKFHSEILALKNREPMESINLNKDTEGSCSNKSENSSDIRLDISRTPPTESPLITNPTSRILFPSSMRPTGMTQFFQNSSRVPADIHKMEQQTVKDESLCNMFCGIEDQTGIWPWLEQQHFS